MYKVLIIDDEVYIREGLKVVIPWEKFECEIVAQASNGEEGVEKIMRYKPDIVISDIRMPKKNGLEMIEEIKGINHDIQLIILTGFREFEYAQQAIKLGVLRFLLKPSKLGEIKEAVEAAVSNLNQLSPGKKEEISGRKSEDKPKYIVEKAVRYIEFHYKEKLDLQTVADELYISTWYLCKLIKKETGSNFIELLNKERIAQAKCLLMETHMKIYEIAEEVGYADTAYFSKIFKKITGKTPNEFRNTRTIV